MWGDHFWSPSYCSLVRRCTVDDHQGYIENQKRPG
ncbi:hypothetical protein [Streptomyces sp. NPDC051909]